jgi:hypothetical protein
MVKISDENMLYLERYRKDKFLSFRYTRPQICFLCSSKYNKMSTKTSQRIFWICLCIYGI